MRCSGRRGFKTTQRWPCTLDARLCTRDEASELVHILQHPQWWVSCSSLYGRGVPRYVSLPLSAVGVSVKAEGILNLRSCGVRAFLHAPSAVS